MEKVSNFVKEGRKTEITNGTVMESKWRERRAANLLMNLVRPAGIEPATCGFEASHLL